jgi:hypothetical protein
MNTEAGLVGGPNPDGQYLPGMIDGVHRYRVSSLRGTVTYLGFQVLAGRGLTPRRMAAYVSDRDLTVDADGQIAFVLAVAEPTAEERRGATWVPMPEDVSAVVVHRYIADRSVELPAEFAIATLDPVGPPTAPTDASVGEQLTAMGWTIAKLMTLHRTVSPEALDHPNQLFTIEAGPSAAKTRPRTTSRSSAPSGWAPTKRWWSSSPPRPAPGTGASRWRTSDTSASTTDDGPAQ